MRRRAVSYTKARDILQLAAMAKARFSGVTLEEIRERFEVDHRTAQRMVRTLEEIFPDVEVRIGSDHRRSWKLADMRSPYPPLGLQEKELAALETSILRAQREDAASDVRALEALRDRLIAAMPSSQARRAEANVEGLLEALGYASRCGPGIVSAEGVVDVIAEALRGPFVLSFDYRHQLGSAATRRSVEPYGLLLGARRYLVARDAGAEEKPFKHYRVDRIIAPQLEPQSFARDTEFNLEAHAARAFGSFHREAEVERILLRFTPAAANVAREFQFHPDQRLTIEEDGSLLVEFRCSGHLELVWHLYQWGDAVEVLTPPALAADVHGYRRSDFASLP